MPPNIKMEATWGFGHSKLKEGILGLQGDHEEWKLGAMSFELIWDGDSSAILDMTGRPAKLLNSH